MEIVGFDQPTERPSTVIGQNGKEWDLHSDAYFTSLHYELDARTLSLRFTMVDDMWKSPHLPERADRPAVAMLDFVFSRVQSIEISGDLSGAGGNEDTGVSFFEFSAELDRLGTFAFHFDNGSSVRVSASRCQLSVSAAR